MSEIQLLESELAAIISLSWLILGTVIYYFVGIEEMIMAGRKSVLSNPTKSVSLLTSLLQQLRLTWLLMQDGKVPVWVKALIPLSIIYVLSPIDLLPDVILGLGQLDDLGILLLAMTSFIKLCPPDLVQYYRHQLANEVGSEPQEIVDTTYRMIDEE